MGGLQCPLWVTAYINTITHSAPLLSRLLIEDVALDVISLHQNEELMRLSLVMVITPRLFPSFSLPLTSHLYFEQEADKQKIYR